ncbi:hypothetical protein CTAYLR_005496 [Chrysophaeum taylorii]|uniref:Uncharacterized protein n=1 Tax=Chrysophaeum taylorii TaxID=2483200 RepID=A0AAD7XH80_9STRA|nr:hypothetical protein CTAYLR_005496 [Chrysophaeum taylorii]
MAVGVWFVVCVVVDAWVAQPWVRQSLRAQSAKRDHLEKEEDDAPPEVAGDVRDFRARLISRSRCGGLLEDSEECEAADQESWAYETPLIEQGSVLLGGTRQDFGFALRQQYFHKCAVVIVQHDANFTKGVIVNRPSQRTLDGWTVWLGGDVCEGGVFAAPSPARRDGKRLDVECLTALDLGNEGSTVVKGVSRCSFDTAKRLVADGKASQSDFWVFCGYAGWVPGQLEGELERGSWFVAAADGGSLLGELLKTRDIFNAESRQLADGVATWESLMRRIGRDDDVREAAGTLDDKMLRTWVDVRLSSSKIDAAAFSKNAVERRRADEALRRLAGPPDEPIARGALVAGAAVGPDFVLDRQFLHKSLALVVASSKDVVVAATLNRPTKRAVSLELQNRRVVRRAVAFGGELAARGAPGGVVWLKLGPLCTDTPGERLDGPLIEKKSDDQPAPLRKRRDKRVHLCGPRDVAKALASGDCAVTDLLAVCGVTAWQREEFSRLLGTGALVPLEHDKFPWRQVFGVHDHPIAADDDDDHHHHQKITLDDGIDVWQTALDQAIPVSVELAPGERPVVADDLDAAKATNDLLADQALEAFRTFFLD